MGYTTSFQGAFQLDRKLKPAHANYLRKFAGTRRMHRDPAIAAGLSDPVREAVCLPIGEGGGYFVGGLGWAGQEPDASVLSTNGPSPDQPSLWCHWIPDKTNCAIIWDGGEKFNSYGTWLYYICRHFLFGWGYRLNGHVHWQGESPDDNGILVVRMGDTLDELATHRLEGISSRTDADVLDRFPIPQRSRKRERGGRRSDIVRGGTLPPHDVAST